jgi:penicillin amidase
VDLFVPKTLFKTNLEKGFQSVLTTHIMKQMIAGQISNDNSLWWDNIETKTKKKK